MRAAIRIAGAMLAFGSAIAPATAQQAPYPSKPIIWVLGFGAGSVVNGGSRGRIDSDQDHLASLRDLHDSSKTLA